MDFHKKYLKYKEKYYKLKIQLGGNNLIEVIKTGNKVEIEKELSNTSPEDIIKKDNDGLTLLDLALSTTNTEIIKMIQMAYTDAIKKIDNKGEYKKALELGLADFEICKRVFGDTNRLTLNSMNNLVIYYINNANYNKALELGKECFEKCKSVFGVDDRCTLTSMSNLALVYFKSRKYNEANLLETECLDRRRKNLGPRDLDTLISEYNLASILCWLRRCDEGIELGTKCLNTRKEILGENHQLTLASLSNIALCKYLSPSYEESIRLGEECLEKQKSTLGPLHPETLKTLNNLIEAYTKKDKKPNPESLQKNLDLTIELYNNIKELFQDNDMNPKILNSMCNVAQRYYYIGNVQRAIEIANEVKERIIRKDPNYQTNQFYLRYLEIIGQYYYCLGQYTEASACINEMFKIESLEKNDDTLLLRIQYNKALDLAVMGKTADAIVLVEKTIADALEKKIYKPIHPIILNYRLTLAKMLDRINEKSRATEICDDVKKILDSDKSISNTYVEGLESLIYIRSIALGPEHPLTLSAKENLAIINGYLA